MRLSALNYAWGHHPSLKSIPQYHCVLKQECPNCTLHSRRAHKAGLYHQNSQWLQILQGYLKSPGIQGWRPDCWLRAPKGEAVQEETLWSQSKPTGCSFKTSKPRAAASLQRTISLPSGFHAPQDKVSYSLRVLPSLLYVGSGEPAQVQKKYIHRFEYAKPSPSKELHFAYPYK